MNMPIGRRLQEIRKQKRLTAAEVAGRIGISRPYVTQLEGGTRRLSVINLMKIAEVLGVSIPDIFQEDAEGVDRGSTSLYRHIRPINTPAVRQTLQPVLGARTDEFINCAELWLKTPEGVRKALEVFEDYLERRQA